MLGWGTNAHETDIMGGLWTIYSSRLSISINGIA